MNRFEGHISRSFDGALGALHLHVVAMGSLAVDQIRTAARSYAMWDQSLASTVLERESAMNAYDRALDEEHLALLIRRQPVASDLKFVIACSRAVAELERIGDEAEKIARVVLEDDAAADPLTKQDIAALAQQAESNVRRSLEALDALDRVTAAAVIAADKALDANYKLAMERLLSRPASGLSGFKRAVHAAFIMKSLERVGDHARNLARLIQV